MHSISVACCLVVAALAARGGALEQVSVPGITFAIDTVRVTQDVHPDPGETGRWRHSPATPAE